MWCVWMKNITWPGIIMVIYPKLISRVQLFSRILCTSSLLWSEACNEIIELRIVLRVIHYVEQLHDANGESESGSRKLN